MSRRRTYTKRRRAEAESETRGRIVEALLALHEDVGPSRTTISAVAERAGVERLTVYRHFPDESSMYQACSSLWVERNPPPEIPSARADDPLGACRATLLQLYGWYRRNTRMLTQLTADLERVPAMRPEFARIEAYLEGLATAIDRQWPRRNGRRLATVRHAVAFSTWRSLDDIAGSDRQSATLVMEWLGATDQRGTKPVSRATRRR